MLAACAPGDESTGSEETSTGDGDLGPLPPVELDCDAIAPELVPFGPLPAFVGLNGIELEMGPCGHVGHDGDPDVVFPDGSILDVEIEGQLSFAPTGDMMLVRGSDEARLVDLRTRMMTAVEMDYSWIWVPTFDDGRVGSKLFTCRGDAPWVYDGLGGQALDEPGTCDLGHHASAGAPLVTYGEYLVNTDTGAIAQHPPFDWAYQPTGRAGCVIRLEIGYDGDFVYYGRLCSDNFASPESSEIYEFKLVDARTGAFALESSDNLEAYSVPQRGGAWWFHPPTTGLVEGPISLLIDGEFEPLFADVIHVAISQAEPLFVIDRVAPDRDQLLRSVDGGHEFELLGEREGVFWIFTNPEGNAVAVVTRDPNGLELWSDTQGWTYAGPIPNVAAWNGAEILVGGTMLARHQWGLMLLSPTGSIIEEWAWPETWGWRLGTQFVLSHDSPDGVAVELVAADGTHTTLLDGSFEPWSTKLSPALSVLAVWGTDAVTGSLHYGRL